MRYTRQACNNHAKGHTLGTSYKGQTHVVGVGVNIFHSWVGIIKVNMCKLLFSYIVITYLNYVIYVHV